MSEDISGGGPVLVEQRGRILIVTINRPRAKNAIDAAVSQGLADAMDRLDGDPALSVGIITGAGGTFCAGMDLKAFARGENVAVEGRGLGFTERPPSKPLIAAVEGYALAGGTEVALATDLIVAAEDSAFGIPEVKRGLVAGGGGLFRLPLRIPSAIAMQLALTGENLPAPRAHELGMVNVLTQPGGALEAAIALAEQITANGPLGRCGDQARHDRVARMVGRGTVDSSIRDHRTGVCVEGRQGGGRRLRREASTRVDEQLVAAEPAWR